MLCFSTNLLNNLNSYKSAYLQEVFRGIDRPEAS